MKKMLLTLVLLATVSIANSKVGVDTVYSEDNHKVFTEIMKLVHTGNNVRYEELGYYGACAVSDNDYFLYEDTRIIRRMSTTVQNKLCNKIVHKMSYGGYKITDVTMFDIVQRRYFGMVGYEKVKNALVLRTVPMTRKHKMRHLRTMFRPSNCRLLNRVNDKNFDKTVAKIATTYFTYSLTFMVRIIDGYNHGVKQVDLKTFMRFKEKNVKDLNNEVKIMLTNVIETQKTK